MTLSSFSRRSAVGVAAGVVILLGYQVEGQEAPKPRTDLKEPVYHVSNRVEPPKRPDLHPLDPALEKAREGLEVVRTIVDDYSCILVKRERVNGVLNGHEYIYTEVRNERSQNGVVTTPFSVYMRFLKPANVKGREVIFVKGRNSNKLVARDSSKLFKVMPPIWLNPNGPIAMRGQLYPITDVGIENLIEKLLEKGERDRKRGECEVEFIPDAAINGRKCTILEVKHPIKRPHFDFHVARIFIDDELKLPVRYAAYGWPCSRRW